MGRILVTGSKGTLGDPLVAELRARGHEVWGCDLQHQADQQYFRADVANYRQLERVFEQKYDYVYHLAAEFGRINGEELFTAKELTVQPGVRVNLKDNGAYGLITVQGSGWIGKKRLHTPALIRFGELTEDEVFVTYESAKSGVVFDNNGTEPLVTLRYFGPGTNPQAPNVGDYKKK